jgi:hypothetical protein
MRNYPIAAGWPGCEARSPFGENAYGVLSIAAMIAAPTRYRFWFYGYPSLQAEDGSRSV